MSLRELAIAEHKVRQLEYEKQQIIDVAKNREYDIETAKKWLGQMPDLVNGNEFEFDGFLFRIWDFGNGYDFTKTLRVVFCEACNVTYDLGEYKPFRPADLGAGLEWWEKQNHVCASATSDGAFSIISEDYATPTAEQELFAAVTRVVRENSCQGSHPFGGE